MQRSICRLLGACGLIFTFTASAQTAGGGAAAGGTAGATTAPAGTTGGARVGVAGNAAGTTAQGGRATASGTAVSPQNVSTLPGQSLSVVPPTTGTQGQPGLTAPAASGTQISAPNTAAVSGATPPGAATATAAGTTAAARSQVSFNALPAGVQSQIAAQLPAGAQLGAVIAETTPQGTTYRAQILQNGVISEMALNGVGTAATGSSALRGATGGLTATGSGTLGTAGFVVGTPYTFDQLPAGVQSAFAAQGALGMTNVSWMPAGNGGVFRAMVDGRPVDVRMAANGQVIPNPSLQQRALAAAATTASTNALTLDDLPVAVQDTIRTNAPFAKITRISKSETASGDVYDITMRTNDRLSMMQVSDTGTVIKENHDLAAAVTGASELIRTNEPPKLAWNSLPNAVRDAIAVQTTPDTIKALLLTNHLGKTAYVVDYVDKDAIRNRLYVNKQGLVVDTQTNLFGIAMSGKPVVIDDLPAPARAVVQQQAEKAAVTRIDLAMYGLTPVYVVTYERDGEARQMIVSREGRRMDANVGAPAVTTIGSDKAPTELEIKATEAEIKE